ncbi:DUF300-domain-containing protein [Gonapodya prolifera JEL478]|uniref:DUF300-domain-containing protein n=1 Tax=Gonapodya prolifera (strain JEL478) TaxID=1344416 RepID=A0A139AST2_GONPJ|nr:DUF300-domain-containing protein [Gonapodya prolifera JEL478]|eukprot:KXS19790.1 DUF300-domain-containing protein [Gonapodya prolifera JEL478]
MRFPRPLALPAFLLLLLVLPPSLLASADDSSTAAPIHPSPEELASADDAPSGIRRIQGPAIPYFRAIPGRPVSSQDSTQLSRRSPPRHPFHPSGRMENPANFDIPRGVSVMEDAGGDGDDDDLKISPITSTIALVCTLFACTVTLVSIWHHLKNYRRPDCQRLIIRILWMVPVYSVSSYISLNSWRLASYIDTLRDVYEAFVIYTFFSLCVNFLGGERDLLIDHLRGRPKTPHMWPLNYVLRPMEVSDPNVFLLIRRMILQFVIVKPLVGVLTLMLKLAGWYYEGWIALGSAYLYFSLAYNVSVSLSMYGLVMFYLTCHHDLAPFRPLPKFLVVKAIIFFSFWQSFVISILVWAGAIRQHGAYSAENVATSIQDFLICLESVFFAMGHYYAFPPSDYDPDVTPSAPRLCARVPLWYAFRDAVGMRDFVNDAWHTLKGTTFGSYERRDDMFWVRDGHSGGRGSAWNVFSSDSQGGYQRVDTNDGGESGWATSSLRGGLRSSRPPGMGDLDHDFAARHAGESSERARDGFGEETVDFPDPFNDSERDIEDLYRRSRRTLFGDYNYPALGGPAPKLNLVPDYGTTVGAANGGATSSQYRGGSGLNGSAGFSTSGNNNSSLAGSDLGSSRRVQDALSPGFDPPTRSRSPAIDRAGSSSPGLGKQRSSAHLVAAGIGTNRGENQDLSLQLGESTPLIFGRDPLLEEANVDSR